MERSDVVYTLSRDVRSSDLSRHSDPLDQGSSGENTRHSSLDTGVWVGDDVLPAWMLLLSLVLHGTICLVLSRTGSLPSLTSVSLTLPNWPLAVVASVIFLWSIVVVLCKTYFLRHHSTDQCIDVIKHNLKNRVSNKLAHKLCINCIICKTLNYVAFRPWLVFLIISSLQLSAKLLTVHVMPTFHLLHCCSENSFLTTMTHVRSRSITRPISLHVKY